MTVLSTAIGNIVNRTAFFYNLGSGKIGFIQLDCTVSETHSRTAKVSQNEIEDGSEIADNVVLGNEKLTIEGIISEAPLPSGDIRDIANTVTQKGFSFLNKKAGVLSGGLIKNAGPTIKRIIALIQLENFWKNKVPFTIITGLKKYDNVIITGLEIPVDFKTGKSLRFKIDCEVVRVVKSKKVKLSNLKKKVAHSASDKSKLAKQATKAADPKGSIAFQAKEFLKNGGFDKIKNFAFGGG